MIENNGRFKKGEHRSPETEFKKGEHWRQPKEHWKREWLFQQYVKMKKSSAEIAYSQGCTENNILFWLQKYNISRRSMTEIRKNKYWGLKGKTNGMFGRKGAENPHWKGGITPERQNFYLSEEWKKACYIVWKRDKATCQRCGIKNNKRKTTLAIHHIIPFEYKQLRSNIKNLILLCILCHRFVHSKKNTNNEFLGGGGADDRETMDK